MRAVEVPEFGPLDVLQVVERPTPEPGPGEVAIAVTRAGVNFADVMTRRGQYHAAGSPPLIPGLEVAGEVVALGEGVTAPAPGTRVAASTGGGGYAEVATAPAGLTYTLPSTIKDDVAGACAIIVPTAVLLIDEVVRLRPDDAVLVHAAAGGLGTVLGQLARLRGARLVLGAVGSPDKVGYAAGFGYDAVVPSDDVAAAVADLTGGRGVDVVIDSVGGDTRAAAVELLAPTGRLIAMGNATGEAESAPDASRMRTGNLGYVGFSMGSLSRSEPHRVRAAAREGIALLAEGRLRIDITAVHRLEEARDAHRALESRRSRGKLLLDPKG